MPAEMAMGIHLSCTLADSLVCIKDYWLPNHAATLLPNGSMMASPSGVNVCLSNLSTGLLLIGRVGDWDPATKARSPAVFTDLSQHCKKYKKQAWRSE